jgi:hypothetical protein
MPHACFYENRELKEDTADETAAELPCVRAKKRSVDRADADALNTFYPQLGQVAIRLSSERCAR